MHAALHPVLLPTHAERVPRGRRRVAHQSAVARRALAASAEEAGAALGELQKDANDAPLATNGWHWSVSHAARWAAGVVARTPVGIDVEGVEPVAQEVVSEVTTRAELDLFGGFSWLAFARLWTAKEAVLKKAGCGLSELSGCRLVAVPGPCSVVLHHRAREHFVHQSVLHEHVCSLASDGPEALAVTWSWREAAP
jgi:4'-phosphopantetheinyl transferase